MTLTRKRPRSGIVYAKSAPSFASNRSSAGLRHDLVQRFLHELRLRACRAAAVMRSPYRRMRGGSPAMKCRSEPRFSRTSVRNASISGTVDAPQPRPADAGWSGVGCGPVMSIFGSMLVSVTYFWNALLVGRIGIGVVRIDLARRDRRRAAPDRATACRGPCPSASGSESDASDRSG